VENKECFFAQFLQEREEIEEEQKRMMGFDLREEDPYQNPQNKIIDSRHKLDLLRGKNLFNL